MAEAIFLIAWFFRELAAVIAAVLAVLALLLVRVRRFDWWRKWVGVVMLWAWSALGTVAPYFAAEVPSKGFGLFFPAIPQQALVLLVVATLVILLAGAWARSRTV